MDSYAIAAEAMKAMIDVEFAPEQITAEHDELHESLGVDGPVVGIAPDRLQPMAGNRAAMHTLLHVQFFDIWEKDIDPTMVVDPRIITGYHNRLLTKIRTTTVTTNNDHWFFQWEGTEFPRDPVGNKTRFVASFRAWSDNTALVETRP